MSQFIALLADRGDVLLYHRARTNHCPRCGRTNWLVGRVTAECASCQTALPLVSDRPEQPLTPDFPAQP
ncbi:hypothetical protein [Sphingomonas sp. CCH15-F11]|uniref:hypothetical protein n=1 Tax=Sphingomonas sp. CCH15-F11 TaxID=1768785 RepID=UPI000834E27E|nr:hypothetical protein [Sphingomonas sp. CCH15-F11]